MHWMHCGSVHTVYILLSLDLVIYGVLLLFVIYEVAFVIHEERAGDGPMITMDDVSSARATGGDTPEKITA